MEPNEERIEHDDNPGFIKQTIHIPIDDFDGDDEEDERIMKLERRKKMQVDRGGFYGI